MDPKEKEQLFQKLDALILDLAYEHQSIYYVLAKEDEGICYRENPLIPNGVKTGEVFPFQETAFAYGNTFVETKDKERFLQFVRFGNITKKLENNVVISCTYQAVYNNQTASHTMRIMRTIVDKKEAFLVCIANDKKTANDLLQEVKDKDRKRNEGLRRIMHEIRAPLRCHHRIKRDGLKRKGPFSKDTKLPQQDQRGSLLHPEHHQRCPGYREDRRGEKRDQRGTVLSERDGRGSDVTA